MIHDIYKFAFLSSCMSQNKGQNDDVPVHALAKGLLTVLVEGARSLAGLVVVPVSKKMHWSNACPALKGKD